jgi:CBS domain-containing protein
MAATTKAIKDLTAGDLMSREVIVLSREMPLREAARLMLQKQIAGAPVVDAQGKCVGVLSAMDFVRLAEKRQDPSKPTAPPLPITCPFQAKHRRPDGSEVILCLLPPGVCPLQETRRNGKELLVCREPRCVLCDWQIVEVEKLPTTSVGEYMTADAVTVPVTTCVRDLARRMIDAHIHRVIVVDDNQKPVGVVSSTDVLAAVAYSDQGS